MHQRLAEEMLNAVEEAGHRRRPVAVLNLDAVDHNLADLRRRAASTPIRVASKSLRVRSLISHCMDAEGFSGVMAFTLPEALWLVGRGLRDLLVAYPTVDRDALRQLAADDRARAEITIMVDSPAHLDFLDELLPDRSPIRVALELDASYAPTRGLRFGAWRSPLRTADQVVELARDITSRPGFTLVGVMAYEGQVAGVPDAGHGPYARAVREMKRRSTREIASRRADAVAAVREVADLEFVNGGGTGSLETTCAEPSVTEAAAGSGIIGPGLFDRFRGFRPEPALHFGLDVVRRPAAGVATLAGGGWVASGTPGRDKLPRIAWPIGLSYARDEGAGEVQTPVLGQAASRLDIGDAVWMRHAKAGELAERVASYLVIRRIDGTLRVTDEWPTYRGEGLVTP